jgi:cell volume regulation protein A
VDSWALELAVSVGMLTAAVGFAIGLAIGRGRQPRWQEKGSFVHKVTIGFATLDRLDAVLLRFEVEPGSRLAGVELDELRLPTGSAIPLIARDKWAFVPDGRTVLRTGDQVLAVASLDHVSELEDRLRAVSRSGRLARWYEAIDPPSTVHAFGVRRSAA